VAGRSERVAVSLFYWSLRRLLELVVLWRRSEREKEVEILLACANAFARPSSMLYRMYSTTISLPPK
jgi:hypothetical protein